MTIPTEPIGSIPRPLRLLEAIAAWDGTDPKLDPLYEAAIRDTIERFEATGSPVITDGEQRKYQNFWTYCVQGLPNTAPDGFRIPFAAGHTRRMPRLTEGPFRYQRYADSYLDVASRYAHKPLKQAVISPSALSLMYPDEEIPGYPREQFILDLLNEHETEVRNCLRKGAHKVQIDFTEGRLAVKIDPSGHLLNGFIDLNNLALSRFSTEDRRRIGVHTCPGGDLDSTHSADIDYADLLPSLFELKAGNFYIALAGERDRVHVLKIIRDFMKPHHRVFVGVVAPIDPRVETPEEVRDRVLEAAEYIPVERLGTTDDCGFSPFCDDTSTTRDTAFAKIHARVLGTALASKEARDRVMAIEDEEERRLRSVALQNANAILLARQRAERELADEQERLRITLASIGDAVISTDAEGRVIYLNGVAEALTGWTQADGAGRHLPEVFHIINEETRQPAENPALKALREGVVVGLANHTVLIAQDGTERPIDDSAAPILDESGAPVGVVLVFRDVTERRRADVALARLAAIVESSQDAIVSKTLDSVIRTWNAGAERIFGYTAEEAVGRSITMLIPPERMNEEEEILARLSRGEVIEHYETVRVTKDGRRLDISLTISPIRDGAGHIIAASKVARDITERRRAEDALRASEQRFRTLAAHAPVGIFLIDQDGNCLFVNECWCEMAGLSPEEAGGQGWVEAVHPDDRERVVDEWYAAAEAGEPFASEYRFRTPQGKVTWLQGQAVGLLDETGGIKEYIGTLTDITERKAAVEALREADRRKDDFLALLAHELRNPLAPLRNGLQVMRLASSDANLLARTRDMMDRQLSHMVRLIDDLFDISRISRNKLELRRSRVLLADVISNAAEASRPALEAAGHELTVSLPPKPLPLDADLTRLAQVFGNLLNNSVKYTEPGGRIWLTATEEGNQVAVTVRDTGIGIPAFALRSIFDMFSQVDRSIERSTGGLGIGLALVKGLVEMHGGTVEAMSDGEGKGSTFTVRLPAVKERPESSPETPAERGTDSTGEKRRILVVDDNRDSAASMAIMLELLGNEVRTAHAGDEAVEVAEQFRPQVVLMDLGMPGLNGYDATRRIREQPWGREMFIIALTGWGQEADRAKSRQAGCDGHLVKPVDLSDLKKLLIEL